MYIYTYTFRYVYNYSMCRHDLWISSWHHTLPKRVRFCITRLDWLMYHETMYSIQSYLGSIPSFFFKTAICRPTLKLQNHFVINPSLAHSPPPKKKDFPLFSTRHRSKFLFHPLQTHLLWCELMAQMRGCKKGLGLGEIAILFRPALRDKSRWFSKSR